MKYADAASRFAGLARPVGAGRRLRWLLASTAAAVLAITAHTGSASAAFLHSSTPTTFGPDGTSSTKWPSSRGEVRIDQANQRLYVHEHGFSAPESDSLFGFDMANSFAPLGGNFPVPLPRETYFQTHPLAIDNTSLSTGGRIYGVATSELKDPVLDSVNEEITGSALYGFSKTGAPLGGVIPLELPPAFFPCTAAVDSKGHIWISEGSTSSIHEFSPSGEELGGVVNLGSDIDESICEVTINLANDDLYLVTRENEVGSIRRYTAASNYTAMTEIDPSKNSYFNAFSQLAFDSKHGILYVFRFGSITAYNADGVVLEEINPGTFLETIAVDESTGTLYGYGDAGNNERQVFAYPPSANIPDVTTGAATGTTVSAHVEPAGGGNVISCKFEYSEDDSFVNSVPCDQAAPYSGPTDVTATLPGLTPELLYHYRIRVTNANGFNVSAGRTFIPHYVQDLRTDAADGLTKTGANLTASYVGTGLDTHYYFEWGPDTAYGNETAPPPRTDDGIQTGPRSPAAPITGLTPGSTYHYRVIASNSEGTSIGRDQSFQTPVAVTGLVGSVSDVTGSSVTLNADWVGDGTDTHYYFEWGFTKAYEHVSATPPGQDAGSGVGPQHKSIELTGLLPTGTYHYRVVASNPSGTTALPDAKFKTPQLPLIRYRPESELTQNSVILRGTVNPRLTGATTYHFEYGPTTSYGSVTPESGSVGADKADHPASAKIEGLVTGSTYHYRMVATSSTGVALGQDREITLVPDAPSIFSIGGSASSGTTAVLSAQVKPGFGSTVVYFQYGLHFPYSSSTNASEPLPSDNQPHATGAEISSLSPNTTYHFRAVAINFFGSTVSDDQTFQTPGLPAIGSTSVTDISQTSAALTASVVPNLASTTVHFEYGLSRETSTATPDLVISADDTAHEVTAPLGGLAPGTTYRYWVVAHNAVGGTTSTSQSFTTQAATPTPRPPRKKCPKGKVKRGSTCVKKHKTQKRKPGRHDRGGNR